MTIRAERDLGQSAFSAFRSGIATGREAVPADSETLAVATLLRQATLAPDSPASRRMLREATRIAKQSLGPKRLGEGCLYDVPGAESPLDVFRILCDRCNENGLDRMESHLLESLERLAIPGSITAGRIAIRRVRNAFEAGNIDYAEMQSEALLRSEFAKAFDELRLRALALLAGVAAARGNLPACRRFALRSIRIAGDGFPQQRAIAYDFLAQTLARSRDLSGSLHCHWKSYELVRGKNRIAEMMFLSDMSQTLLDAGYPGPARAGFARLLADWPDVQMVIPILGGYAVASAALGDRDAVEWSIAQLLLAARRRIRPRYVAQSLLECSEALAAIGEFARAGTLRRRSLRMAERYGFHDLTFKAEAAAAKVVPLTQLTEAAKAIAAQVSEMEPERMPLELVYGD